MERKIDVIDHLRVLLDGLYELYGSKHGSEIIKLLSLANTPDEVWLQEHELSASYPLNQGVILHICSTAAGVLLLVGTQEYQKVCKEKLEKITLHTNDSEIKL